MTDISDLELLRNYCRQGSEAAFATLVQRHVNLVYSVAFRHVGIAAQAEEITQAVFVILARKAASLRPDTILEGWLHETARLTALSFRRGERRRQFREQQAYMQSTFQTPDDTAVWNQLAPMLDEALSRLGKKDRDAVVLRFFNEKNLREVAVALNVTEVAAQRRVHRAVEKLRKFFTKRGVALSAAAVMATISANSVQAAPAGLAKTVTALAVIKGATAGGPTLTLIKGALKLMAWTKVKTVVVVGIAAVLATGATTVIVEKNISSNRASIYEAIFEHPDGSSEARLEQCPPVLFVSPTRHPNQERGIWTASGRGVFDGAQMAALVSWAYEFDQARVIMPANSSEAEYDYLNTMPSPQNALREEIKRQFGLTAHRETRPTDVLLLRPSNRARLDSFLTKGGSFACYGTAEGNIQHRYFTNAPLSMLAEQMVQGYFEKPCVDLTDPNAKYDFTFQWEEPRGLTGDARLAVLRPVIEDRINQLGLELVPTNMPLEMLLVDKMR